MAYRNPARFLAPLALVASAVAVVAIYKGTTSSRGSDSSGGTSAGASHPASSRHSGTRAGTAATRHAARTYTVKPGDVLSTIAEKTGVPLATIQRLNPNADAQTLHAGQKLKLAP
jgi:LysM repeat protein